MTNRMILSKEDFIKIFKEYTKQMSIKNNKTNIDCNFDNVEFKITVTLNNKVREKDFESLQVDMIMNESFIK